jgi:thiamine-phosphate pyrophosphorylase
MGRPFRLLAISQLFDVPGAASGTAGTASGAGAGAAATGAAATWFAALAAAGVDALQLREKRLDDLALHRLAVQARAALPPPARLLVNGRADVALAAGADGVHLPADGVPAAALRSRFGRGLLIGVSTHRLEEVEQARDDGADYVVFGPIYSMPAEPAHGPPAGPRLLAGAAGLGIPVYALGGVTLDRFAEVAAAGAAGVAAIRLFQRPAAAGNPAAAAGAGAGTGELGAWLRRVVAAAAACFP